MRIITYLSQLTSLFVAILFLGFAGGLLSNQAFADMKYNYDIPTQREDGSVLAIEDIDSYIIKYSINNEPYPDTIVIDPAATEVIVLGGAGIYSAQIATKTKDGQIGGFSDIVTGIVGTIVKPPPAKQTMTGTWVCNETPCILEMK